MWYSDMLITNKCDIIRWNSCIVDLNFLELSIL